ncbi:ion channel [Candidatus Merdisoma sp. JLR.KK006]|uniref:ion channel n=1 Tax=Candidatus Merdisoma sp. JLR.KK006 TaxID=3112626 RepID=UPI002FEFA6FC
MKARKKIYLCLVAIIALIYISLLIILYCSESVDSDAMIRTFGDAFWYSLVTLTTVGYGDLVPVTPLGHTIGMIFLLLSAGIMVTMLGAVVSFITSEGFPFLMLSLQRHKNWYYFADCGVESNTLAANIYKEDSNALIIYGEKRNSQSEIPNYPCIYLSASPAKIVAKKKNIGTKCKVFLMKENDIGINRRASNLHELPVEVYARTTNGQDKLSGNINFFHSYECCARQYWRSKPLCRHENTIVLIGFGNYGSSILERAILTNIVSVEQHVAYHIFGKAEEFLAIHYRLGEMFSLDKESETRDSLIFHEEAWEENHFILEQADRIIICEDDEQIGWGIFWTLNRYYRISGRIDLRSSWKVPEISCFGINEDIYTTQQIIRTELNKAAVMINEIFRKSVSYPTRCWDELDDLHRQSKIVAADHLLMKTRILLDDETITELTASVVKKAYERYCKTKDLDTAKEMYRKLDHMRGLRFYTFYNWSYGPVRDDTARQHPMLCPYEELTPEQKQERDAAWELMGNISVELE